jgi:hypothetical protein
MTLYEQLLEDLAAEQAALDAVLGGITDTQWDLPIPSVHHLGRRRLRLGWSRENPGAMVTLLLHLLRLLPLLCGAHTHVALENLALRHQLAVHSVRTGQPAFDHVHGTALFSYLESANDAAAIFNDHQSNMTRQDAAAVVAASDFAQYATVIDVGGGHGVLGAAILNVGPRTTVVVFDHPSVIASAPPHLSAEGSNGRLTYEAGDFFDSVPVGGHAYVLKDIVHDWGDQDATEILRNCRLAMARSPFVEAKLLVIEKIIPPGNGAFPGKLTDITMLLVTAGRERTAKEYQTLLADAGFTLTPIVTTRSPSATSPTSSTPTAPTAP